MWLRFHRLLYQIQRSLFDDKVMRKIKKMVSNVWIESYNCLSIHVVQAIKVVIDYLIIKMAGFRSDALRKIFIMMWKNLLLRKRHYIQTSMEIILPTMIFVGIIMWNNSQDTDNMEHGLNIAPNRDPKVTLLRILQ